MVFDEERGDDPFERIWIADEPTYQADSAGLIPPAAVRRKVMELARNHPLWTATDIRVALEESTGFRVAAAVIEQVLRASVREAR